MEKWRDIIRAEIERLKKENNNIRCNSNKAYCQGYDDAFIDLLPFLDSLPEQTPQGWISVKDRLPERGGFYITCVERNKEPKHICADDYFDEKEKEWLYKNESIADVDYWMPIPKFKEE